MKHINTSNYNFSNVISNNLIYADKTKHVWELAKTDGAYFLSRPRRFGKSLLLSTFEELFKGSSEPLQNPQGLFKNLWISGEEPNYDFTDIYPIISLSMAMPNNSTDVLSLFLKSRLLDIADSYDISLNDTIPELMFKDLILGLNRKYNKTVVLLIDEYDDPVSSVIDDPYLANKNARFLKGFYAIIKVYQKYFRFVMLTGVTRYLLLWGSGVLNHLIDLTMTEKHADICGFTYEEFDNCFADRFQITMEKFKEKGYLDKNSGVTEFRQAIFGKYDGYSWDGKTKVLNPYSLLNAFKHENLKSYWAKLEPSKKLLNAFMSKNPLGFTADKMRDLSDESIDMATTIGSPTPVTSLFQTGYLTIDKMTIDDDNDIIYSLKTPNKEIQPAFLKEFSDCLFNFLAINKHEQQTDFIEAIITEDSTKLSILIDSFFGAIPASLHISKEAYYHSVLYGYLKGLIKLQALPEIPGADVTPDILCVINSDLYVIVELKYKDNPERHPVANDQKAKITLRRLAISALEAIDAK
ncbi:MAG: AAA family ATPase, partial [Deltaproteobacteria bacterium]|nr:AAA family ATPase [Deltaproteobacteria bacterium]